MVNVLGYCLSEVSIYIHFKVVHRLKLNPGRMVADKKHSYLDYSFSSEMSVDVCSR